jgi:hypothetical protein
VAFDATDTGAGGGLPSPAGSDAIYDLSAANPAQLAAADMGKLALLRSTRIGARFTLPAANTLSGKSRHLGISVAANSAPIAIVNGGTPGTHATIDKVLAGGASGRMSAHAVSDAPGAWGFHGHGALPGYPFNMGDPVKKAAATAAPSGNNGYAKSQVCFLSPTLAVTVWLDSGNNPQLYAISLNADRSVQAISNPTQMRSGKACNVPWVCRLSATKVLVGWWNNTDTVNEFAAVSITPGNPPTIGSPGSVVDDSAIAANNRLGITTNAPPSAVQDTTDAVWVTSKMRVTTGLIAYYITVSGTAVALAANNASFNTTSQDALAYWSGYVPEAGKLLIAGRNAANLAELSLLSYSAGSITETWASPLENVTGFGSSTGLSIVPVDVSASIFASVTSGNGASGSVVMFKVDMATGDIKWQRSHYLLGFSGTVFGNTNAPYSLLALGDGELAAIRVAGFPYGYMDLKACVRAGVQSVSSGQAVDRDIPFHQYAWDQEQMMPTVSFPGSYGAFDETTRTLLMISTPQVLSGTVNIIARSYCIPRR